MTGYSEEDFGFAEICAVLSERFGTRFKLHNTGGNCVTLVAQLEGGIQVLITDCVGTLSPFQWHLDGRAAGFFIGVYRAGLDTGGEHIDLPDRFAYTYSETAPPTAEAIGDLVQTWRWRRCVSSRHRSQLSRDIVYTRRQGLSDGNAAAGGHGRAGRRTQ